MERDFYRLPYDERNIDAYTDVLEFNKPAPDDVVSVNVGTYAIENKDKRFVSRGFVTCTGVLVRSEDRDTFGLLHLLPLQELHPSDYDKLNVLAGGEMISIEGSESVSQSNLLEDLKTQCGITYIDTISLDTRDDGGLNASFDLAFRPDTQELLIARRSQKDILVYQGFDLKNS